MRFTVASFALAFSLHAFAAPVERDSTVTPVSAATIATFSPYASFSAATYCSGTANWSCTACKRVPGFIPYATGGDGNAIQYWYVGWWPAGNSVVVAHEGTDPTQLISVATDANALLDPLDPALFPGIPSSVTVHSGFMNAHYPAAPTILAAVKKVIAERKATKVTVTGHSLGGALATLDAVYFKVNLPSTISIKAVTYGQPRVGNQDFANWVDKNISDFTRITNAYDMVPIVPGRGLGYHHSVGEKHIKSAGVWNACAGQDNTSTDCSTGAVPNIFVGSIADHLGPYEGVSMGTIYC
ncbi:hypothetical protein FRC07_005102 [Ceratobasidium sp. 392]|nr:hypothetical protein FRC07_005102 [Ceratobasidium sp. 392]